MQFAFIFINNGLAWFGSLFMGFMLLLAAALAPWGALKRVPVRQHALWGSLAALCLVWSLRFEVMPGLYFHPFLMTTVTLVFGWSFSLLLGALAAVLLVVLGPGTWHTLGWDWVFTVLLPATLAYGLLRMIDLLSTRNLFVYILGLGFFGTIVATLVNCSLMLLFMVLTQPDVIVEQLWDKVMFVIPVLYAEGFINGVLVTSITVFLPDLVKTFDDERFLKSD